MLKFLKRIFRKEETAATPSVAAAPVAAPRVAEKAVGGGVEVASLSLRAILEKLPPELHAIINQMPAPEVKIMLPVNTILKQLPGGAVKMSLASLLRQAPAGTFRKTEVEEKQMVDVQLSEVFKNVDPRRLGRRNDQRRYDVPDDAAGLFGKNGTTRSVSGGAQAGTEVLPSAPSQPVASAPKPPASLPTPAAVPEPPRVVRMPGIAPAAPAPVNGNGNGHAHSPAPAPASAPKPKATAPGGGNGELVISFVELAAGWPEGIRCELSLVPGDTKLVIPAYSVSPGLQKGKVVFPWSQVRMWMRPVFNGASAIADDAELIFPLKIIAPAFVAATGVTKRREAAEIDHSLPDFFGPAAGQNAKPEQTVSAPAAPVPVAPPPPVPAAPEPEPAPAPLKFTLVREEAVPMTEIAAPAAPAVPSAAPEAGATASPAEIVRQACAIQGVAGALIALEEGLVIAQNLPPGFSADTFAAFMPQIFGRLEKYTAEMQLGTATEITIQSEHGPCHIARRGKIYFGTLGRAGERLPESLGNLTAQLASLNS